MDYIKVDYIKVDYIKVDGVGDLADQQELATRLVRSSHTCPCALIRIRRRSRDPPSGGIRHPLEPAPHWRRVM